LLHAYHHLSKELKSNLFIYYIIISLKIKNKKYTLPGMFLFFVAGDEGYKQCAVVASDRALGEPPEANPFSNKPKKEYPTGIFSWFGWG
jgi:hypothetical protein